MQQLNKCYKCCMYKIYGAYKILHKLVCCYNCSFSVSIVSFNILFYFVINKIYIQGSLGNKETTALWTSCQIYYVLHNILMCSHSYFYVHILHFVFIGFVCNKNCNRIYFTCSLTCLRGFIQPDFMIVRWFVWPRLSLTGNAFISVS